MQQLWVDLSDFKRCFRLSRFRGAEGKKQMCQVQNSKVVHKKTLQQEGQVQREICAQYQTIVPKQIEMVGNGCRLNVPDPAEGRIAQGTYHFVYFP